jgi:hypothetical protein
MRPYSTLLVAVSFFVVPSVNCQTAPGAAEQELLRIERETARLEQQNDVSLAKHLANDWVLVGPRRVSKAEFIQNVKHHLLAQKNGINPYTIEKKNVEVHEFGGTAVVTYVKEYRQVRDSSKFFDEDDTDVFTRDASGWHLRFTKIGAVQAPARS